MSRIHLSRLRKRRLIYDSSPDIPPIMSSINPWFDEMDKCTCDYFDKIRVWLPEYNELYRRIQSDLQQCERDLTAVRSNFLKMKLKVFKKDYLDPLLKPLTEVTKILHDISRNLLSEDEAHKELGKALADMPAKKKFSNREIPRPITSRLMDRISGAIVLARKIGYGRGEAACAICIHHSFMPPEIDPSDVIGSLEAKSQHGRNYTPTERFGICSKENGMVSLQDPTCPRSIDQSFFREKDRARVVIQAWKCKSPLSDSGRGSQTWVDEVRSSLKDVDYFAINMDHFLPSEGRREGTFRYDLEASGTKFYDGQSEEALQEFLAGVSPTLLRFATEELEKHVDSLAASRDKSMEFVRPFLPSLTKDERRKEIERPGFMLRKIRSRLQGFLEPSQRSVSNETSAHSTTYAGR